MVYPSFRSRLNVCGQASRCADVTGKMYERSNTVPFSTVSTTAHQLYKTVKGSNTTRIRSQSDHRSFFATCKASCARFSPRILESILLLSQFQSQCRRASQLANPNLHGDTFAENTPKSLRNRPCSLRHCGWTANLSTKTAPVDSGIDSPRHRPATDARPKSRGSAFFCSFILRNPLFCSKCFNFFHLRKFKFRLQLSKQVLLSMSAAHSSDRSDALHQQLTEQNTIPEGNSELDWDTCSVEKPIKIMTHQKTPMCVHVCTGNCCAGPCWLCLCPCVAMLR